MKCDEFELQIHELLDQRMCPSTDRQIELHAGECDSCRETLVAATALCDSLECVDLPEISPDFTDRVMLEFSKPVRPRSSITTTIAALAVVAAVLLVALIPSVQSWLKPDPSLATPDLKVDGSTKPVPTDSAPRIAKNESAPNDNKNTIPAPRPDHATNENALMASLAFPDFPSLSDMSQQIDSDKIPGVRPIRSSFGVVIGLLRRALPGNSGDDDDKPQAGVPQIETQHLS